MSVLNYEDTKAQKLMTIRVLVPLWSRASLKKVRAIGSSSTKLNLSDKEFQHENTQSSISQSMWIDGSACRCRGATRGKSNMPQNSRILCKRRYSQLYRERIGWQVPLRRRLSQLLLKQ
jgi:hypothetical protein